MARAVQPTGGDVTLGRYRVNLLDQIGSGLLSSVYKGVHENTNKKVAVKRIQADDERGNKGEQAINDFKVFERTRGHKYIAALYDFKYQMNAFWMIMEFCEYGDLNNFMKKNDISSDQKFTLMYQCASGLAYMHSIHIVHRDIKPQNILIQNDNNKAVVKISDFGISKMISDKDVIAAYKFKSAVGTLGYLAPEFHTEPIQYDETVDTFALGLVFASMLTHEKDKDLPMQGGTGLFSLGNQMVINKANNKPLPEIVKIGKNDSSVTVQLKGLIKKMTEYEPAERIKITEVENIIKAACDIPDDNSLKRDEMLLQRGNSTKPSEQNALKNNNEECTETSTEKENNTRDLDKDEDESKVESATSNNGDQEQGEQEALGLSLIKEFVKERIEKAFSSEEDKKQIKSASTMAMLHCALRVATFKVGDEVEIEVDMAKVKRLQAGLGGFHPEMENYLGTIGTVKQLRPLQVDVEFKNGKIWSFNPELVRIPDLLKKSDDNKGRPVSGQIRFKEDDIVRITQDKTEFKRIQEEAGLWQSWLGRIPGLTGIVHHTDADGDVIVELITGEKVICHQAVLKHVNQDDLSIESGDLVFVINDLDRAKRNQEGHGGWNPKMAELLGTTTTVKKTVNDCAVLDCQDNFSFNMKSLKVLAKNDELLNAAMSKRGNSTVDESCKMQ